MGSFHIRAKTLSHRCYASENAINLRYALALHTHKSICNIVELCRAV